MRDTVELLEAIGRDAKLRRASPEVLAQALKNVDASDGVREFASNGDATTLTKELGITPLHGEHHSQTGGHEGDGHDHDHRHHPDDDHSDGKDEPKQRPDDPGDASST
jgi:hypothetical protein